MKKAILVLLSFPISVLADLGVNIYSPSVGTTGTTSSGCVYVYFASRSNFRGSIGNAPVIASGTVPELGIQSAFQAGAGQRLGAIPYTVTAGVLVITEVK